MVDCSYLFFISFIMQSVIERLKTWYFNLNRIENYVRERTQSKKCILLDTEWQEAKRPSSLLYAYRKSNFKYKEIVPIDTMDYVGAKRYMVIY